MIRRDWNVSPSHQVGAADAVRFLERIATRTERVFTSQVASKRATAARTRSHNDVADQLDAFTEISGALQREIDAVDGRMNQLRTTRDKAVERTLRMQAIAKDAAAGAVDGEEASKEAPSIAVSCGAATTSSQASSGAAEDEHVDAEVDAALAIAASLRAATCADDLQAETDGRGAAHGELAACVERLSSFELWNEHVRAKLKAAETELEKRSHQDAVKRGFEDLSWQSLDPQIALLELP